MAALVVTATACSSGRGTGPGAFPAVTAGTDVFVPGSVAAADVGYVDGVAQNFEDGGRLVARLAASAARCVAERWVAIVDPAILRAAGLAPEAMVDVTLDRLAEVTTLDRPRAEALAGSFTVCGVDHTAAFLDSLLLTSQITPTQRVCLAEAIPAGLIGAITVSVLVDAALDPALSTQYQKALDACPPT